MSCYKVDLNLMLSWLVLVLFRSGLMFVGGGVIKLFDLV